MKSTFIILIIQLIVSSNPDKTGYSVDKSQCDTAKFITGRNSLSLFDSSKNELAAKQITITVSYAAIACGCAHWFETKYENVPFLEGVERFYVAPKDNSLINANALYDGEHIPLTLKITGRFSKQKLLPPDFGDKDEPEMARIFWYEKITIISPVKKNSSR